MNIFLLSQTMENVKFFSPTSVAMTVSTATVLMCNVQECSLIYLWKRFSWEEIVKFYSSFDKDQITKAGEANTEELVGIELK